MRTEIKITFKDPTREHGHSTKNYLDVYADGVLICEAYPRRQADGTTQRRLFKSLDSVAKHVRFCVGNSSRGASYLRKEAGVDNPTLPSPL